MTPHPGTTPPPSPEPDLTDLVEQLGDPHLVDAVVGTYLTLMPDRLAAIRVARHAPDEESLRAAHSLRPASALLGLMSLAEACEALEIALRAEPTVAVPALVDDVLERAEQARRALHARTDDPHV